MTAGTCMRCEGGHICALHGAIADIDDFEKLWFVIRTKLNCEENDTRDKWRKLAIRRLRHFNLLTAHVHPVDDHDPVIHPRQVGSASYRSSPKCQCGCRKSWHAEDGTCETCHCQQYANPD